MYGAINSFHTCWRGEQHSNVVSPTKKRFLRLSCSSGTASFCSATCRRSRGSFKVSAVADSGPASALLSAYRKSSSLLHSRHDKDIFNLAIPALFSILLDPIMSLTDTGRAPVAPSQAFCRNCKQLSRQMAQYSKLCLALLLLESTDA